MDETGAVALPQDMEDAGLVEMSQVDQVFHRVLVGWVGLRGEREGGRMVGWSHGSHVTSPSPGPLHPRR